MTDLTILDPQGRPMQPSRRQAQAPLIVTYTDSGRVELSPEGDDLRVASYSDVYAEQPAVAAVVNKLVRQIAATPLKAYRKDGDDLTPLEDDHDLALLLQQPATRRGPSWLKQHLAIGPLVHGNGVLVKYRPDPAKPPTGLLPLDWRYVTGYAAYQGAPVILWRTTQTGSMLDVPADAAVHLAWEAPTGPVGVSPLRQLGKVILLEDGAQRFQAASLKNGARPSGLISLPPDADLDEDEMDELTKAVQAIHGGVDKSMKVALLGGGADWKPMSFSSAEAQLVESRRLNIETVCMVFDVDPVLIGAGQGGTTRTVSELHSMLYRTTLPPWLGLIEDTLQAQLIDPEPEWQGLTVRFDLTSFLRGDPLEEAQALAAKVQAGLISRDEARAALGLPAKGGAAADLFYQANNELPVGSVPPKTQDTAGGRQPTPPVAEPGTTPAP